MIIRMLSVILFLLHLFTSLIYIKTNGRGRAFGQLAEAEVGRGRGGKTS